MKHPTRARGNSVHTNSGYCFTVFFYIKLKQVSAKAGENEEEEVDAA
jgi:hypothetical protein